MKRLSVDVTDLSHSDSIEELLLRCNKKEEFLVQANSRLSNLSIEFYEHIGSLLRLCGFENVRVTREGDVNCRFDATIIDDTDSIPIEIKSPRESREINIKSIEQALENKIVLLSRKFYPTQSDTTSLVIAFDYPPNRSDVLELIQDIQNSFNYKIGLINLADLLSLSFDVVKGIRQLNLDYFNHFIGIFDYDSAFIR